MEAPLTLRWARASGRPGPVRAAGPLGGPAVGPLCFTPIQRCPSRTQSEARAQRREGYQRPRHPPEKRKKHHGRASQRPAPWARRTADRQAAGQRRLFARSDVAHEEPASNKRARRSFSSMVHGGPSASNCQLPAEPRALCLLHPSEPGVCLRCVRSDRNMALCPSAFWCASPRNC